MAPGPHIVIAGLMAVGKTTTARAIADELGRPIRDSDADLQALFGHTGREIAEELGVAELHRLESAVLLGSLAASEPTVITPAAAVVEDARVREALARRALVGVLVAPLDVVFERMAAGTHRRAMDRGELEKLARRREQHFRDIADTVLDATRPTAELAAEVLELARQQD